MYKRMLMVVGVMSLAGCASVVAPLTKDYVASNGEQIRIAFADPINMESCTLKGDSAYNPKAQSIMGVISLGPSQMEAEEMINKTFANRAAAMGANYVNRGFAGSSSFGGVYQRSSTVKATFFACESLPAL